MYEFWYDYVKPKYGANAKLCYMDTDSFIVRLKIEDLTLQIFLREKLPKGKNKKVNESMKDELG